jgi:hypothetical protein
MQKWQEEKQKEAFAYEIILKNEIFFLFVTKTRLETIENSKLLNNFLCWQFS